MKKAIYITLLICHIFPLQKVFGQNESLIKLANEFKIKADAYKSEKIRDSSVVYFIKASEIYWGLFEKDQDMSILGAYINCQNSLAYDISILGQIDTAI